jgi:lipopolysaccharide/colanic/teichoic acid biosynthesis glycosyltransferase
MANSGPNIMVPLPHGFYYRPQKRREVPRRLLDVCVSALALVLFTPVILGASLLIALEDGQPILFTQKRVGRFGKLFVIYKLRTMRVDVCSDAVKPADSSDSRITAIGRYLRKLSIDELPQLLNVLRGDMSLVGPRPEMPFIVQRYEPWQQLRHLVPPGITGLWQVTSRKTIPLHKPEATAIDVAYIRNGSPITDCGILLRTAYSLLSPRGVH